MGSRQAVMAGALVAVVAAGGVTAEVAHGARGTGRDATKAAATSMLMAPAAAGLGPQGGGPANNGAAPLHAPAAPPPVLTRVNPHGPLGSAKTPPPKPKPPAPIVFTKTVGPGAKGPIVIQIQQALAWTGIPMKVTGVYDARTVNAVRKFEDKQGLDETGTVYKSAYTRLMLVTRKGAALDSRCTGTVLCIDKSQKVLRYLVNSKVVMVLDVRFGSLYTPTREGQFSVYWKDRYHVSSIFHTPMPYAMFFAGGQAVHYSQYFAADGYSGHSHGCVNVRDLSSVIKLFDMVSVGTKVVIYRTAPSIG